MVYYISFVFVHTPYSILHALYRLVHHCSTCFVIFGDRKSLLIHQDDHRHGSLMKRYRKKTNFVPITPLDVQFKCTVKGCDKSFDRMFELNRHRLRHSKPFKCRKGCAKAFGSDWDRRIHERTHSRNGREVCKICKLEFADPAALRKHVMTVHHDGSVLKPFACRICHKRFARKFCLQSHSKVHDNGESRKKFICEHCGMCTVSKRNLSRHLKKYHP